MARRKGLETEENHCAVFLSLFSLSVKEGCHHTPPVLNCLETPKNLDDLFLQGSFTFHFHFLDPMTPPFASAERLWVSWKVH